MELANNLRFLFIAYVLGTLGLFVVPSYLDALSKGKDTGTAVLSSLLFPAIFLVFNILLGIVIFLLLKRWGSKPTLTEKPIVQTTNKREQ